MDLTPKHAALFLAVLLMTLLGCSTPQELRQRDEAACTGYGFQHGTAEFATCLQRESIARRYGYYSSYWINGYYWWGGSHP